MRSSGPAELEQTSPSQHVRRSLELAPEYGPCMGGIVQNMLSLRCRFAPGIQFRSFASARARIDIDYM